MGIMVKRPEEVVAAMTNMVGDIEIDEMFKNDSGQIYYLEFPKRTWLKNLLHYFLLAFLCSFCMYQLFILIVVPFYVLLLYRYNIFVNSSRRMNLSKKKLWILFCVMFVICQFVAAILRSIAIQYIFN